MRNDVSCSRTKQRASRRENKRALGTSWNAQLSRPSLRCASRRTTFAKRSAEVLAAFAELPPLSSKGRKMKLEDFLADHIDRLRRGEVRSQPSYLLRRSDLAGEAALKLMWVAGRATAFLPRVGVVRWFRPDGKSDEATFASEGLGLKFIDEARLARIRPQAGLIHARTITARALLDIALALR
jgi:hypothetical protein